MGQSHLLGDSLKRLALIAATALVLTGCAQTPPPVSERVQNAYEEGSKLAPITPKATAPTVAFIGDSYTAGAGASAGSQRWTTLLSAQMGWVENNLGRGGTGYIATAGKQGCGLDYCPSYDEMIAEAVKVKPEIVVVAGGRNDSKADPARLLASVNAFYSKLRAALPESKVVAVNPIWDDDEAPAELTRLADMVRQTCAANDCTYVNIGQPLAGHPDMVGPDGAHPADGGYAAIAAAVKAGLVKNPAFAPKG